MAHFADSPNSSATRPKKRGLSDTKALEKTHDFLRKASNLESDLAHHVDDADALIRGWLAKALKQDYPELDDATARYIAKKKWLAGDTFDDAADDIADALEEGLRVVTPQQLAGIEKHHLLPKEFVERFKAVDIDIEDFVVAVDKEVHRLGPNALHSKDLNAWIGNWNANWDKFFDGQDRSPAEVFAHLSKMIQKYGLDY